MRSCGAPDYTNHSSKKEVAVKTWIKVFIVYQQKAREEKHGLQKSRHKFYQRNYYMFETDCFERDLKVRK